MKSTALLVLAAVLFAACLFFFGRAGDLLADQDYLPGLLHMFVGFSLVRAGVELARLSIIVRHRSV